MNNKKSNKKIPITVLAGFLGSGKTTLLNHILTNSQGYKIGVIVNDFGTINIDSKLVAKKTDTALELTNGCICCSLTSLDLSEAIAQFIYRGSPINYIIIEASGLAEPFDLMITMRDSMNFDVSLDSIVCLIDAENVEKNAKENPTALSQVEYSDFIVVNKVDLIEKKKLSQIHSLINSINPKARIFDTIRGNIDLDVILDAGGMEFRADDKEHDHSSHVHLHESYKSYYYQSTKPFDPILFQKFVNENLPTSIYRAKGLINFGSKGTYRKYIFQLVGSRVELAWDNWKDEKQQTQIVFIGKALNKKDLEEKLNDCIDIDANAELPQGYKLILPKKNL